MRLWIVLLAMGFIGCANIKTSRVEHDGKVLGYLATYEHSADLGGWHAGAIVYDKDGKMQSHQSGALGSLLAEIIRGGATVGAGYFVGRGLSGSGDNISASANGGNAHAKADSNSSSSTTIHNPAPLVNNMD